MFTNATLNTSNWLQQKDHGSSIYTRPVLDSFSFGSRWVLVRSSFVSRSSLVAYSLVYRRPNEDRTRNKQKTNERATNIDRDADEKLSATRRFATVMAGRMSFCNHRTAYCPHPAPAEADSSTFSPTQAFSRRIKPFPPILHIPYPTHSKSPSQALKTHSRHTAQQPPKTHTTRPKHPLTNTKTQPFTASKVGQIPRFRKARE